MNLIIGSQTFIDVQIPLLWGTRAILEDKEGRLSVIDLDNKTVKLEILGDKPAPGVEFAPIIEGFEIFGDGKALYSYHPEEKKLTMIASALPECQISPSKIRIGTNIFSNNVVVGIGVGMIVTESGIGMGAPLPEKLAHLKI